MKTMDDFFGFRVKVIRDSEKSHTQTAKRYRPHMISNVWPHAIVDQAAAS